MKLRYRMKKWMAVLLVAANVLCMTSVGVSAQNVQDDVSLTDSENTASGAAVCYTSIEQAGAEVRQQMVNRKETIMVGYQSVNLESDLEKLGKTIFEKALLHTGEVKEGDYIKYQLESCYYEVESYVENKIYYYTITYTIKYYTTALEEQMLDEKVAEVLAELNLDTKTEYEKISDIYQYICDNVVYDDVHYGDTTYKKQYTAYAALFDKTAVCQGYAVLLYRLMLEAGIDSRIISGVSFNENHAWNIVKYYGKYYYMDATWDSKWSDGISDWSYFLKGTNEFYNHEANDEFLSDEFTTNYPIAFLNASEPSKVSSWEAHAASTFSGGKGTLEAPYLISNAEELALCAALVNANDSKYNDAYYRLTNDIDLSGYNWIPIGSGSDTGAIKYDNSNFFWGSFDGDNHIISGMNVVAYDEIYWYGLFGVSCGEIKNVILKDGVIDIEFTNAIEESAFGSEIGVGGLAADVLGWNESWDEANEKNLVENCKVDVDISVDSKINVICGGLLGGANGGKVSGCSAVGNVTVKSSRQNQVGGCIGTAVHYAIISGCSFRGKVVSVNDGEHEDPGKAEEGWYYGNLVGGFSGLLNNSVRISDCYADAVVEAVTGKEANAGGFCGEMGILWNGYSPVYRNLYCNSIVIKDDSTGKKVSGIFADCNSIQSEGCNFENCMSVWNGDLRVVHNERIQTIWNKYNISKMNLMELFKDTFKFDTDIWKISEDKLPVLAIDEVAVKQGEEKVLSDIGGVENGKKYYGDLIFAVDNVQAKTIVLDGKMIETSENSYSGTVLADNNQHFMRVMDTSGNAVSIMFTVLEQEEGEQPESTKAPVESTQPETGKAPVESTQPETSKAPVESTQPETSKAPVESIQPETSKALVESTQPETSKAPVESIQPETSKVPVESTQPETSKVPVESTKPEISEVPVESSQPIESTSPIESDKPGATSTLGDVNFDNNVELPDAQLVLKAALKIEILDANQMKVADVDGDKEVTLQDAQMVLKAALKIISLQ